MTVETGPVAHRIERRLKMRHYSLLLAFDRLRSITQVANALSLSQPTVTRALADIEDIFMTPLFLRTGRGLKPTPAGDVVIARARLAVADNAALCTELAGIDAGHQGRLRIGVIPYVSGPALDAAWRHLLALRPRVALLAHEDTTRNLIAALCERTLDCAICRFTPDPGEDDLVQELLYHQQAHLVVAAPSAAPLLRGDRTPDVTDLADMDWVLPPVGTPIRQLIDTTFADSGQRAPLPVVEAYAVHAVAHALARLPRGITVLPYDVAKAAAATSAAVVLPQPLGWRLPPVGLAWLRNSPKAAMAGRLVEVMREASSASSSALSRPAETR